MEIVGIYEDAGKSGKSIEGRPAFKKMLSDIGNGLEIDYILYINFPDLAEMQRHIKFIRVCAILRRKSDLH